MKRVFFNLLGMSLFVIAVALTAKRQVFSVPESFRVAGIMYMILALFFAMIIEFSTRLNYVLREKKKSLEYSKEAQAFADGTLYVSILAICVYCVTHP